MCECGYNLKQETNFILPFKASKIVYFDEDNTFNSVNFKISKIKQLNNTFGMHFWHIYVIVC